MQLQPGFLRSLVTQIRFDRNVRADRSVVVTMESPVTGLDTTAQQNPSESSGRLLLNNCHLLHGLKWIVGLNSKVFIIVEDNVDNNLKPAIVVEVQVAESMPAYSARDVPHDMFDLM